MASRLIEQIRHLSGLLSEASMTLDVIAAELEKRPVVETAAPAPSHRQSWSPKSASSPRGTSW